MAAPNNEGARNRASSYHRVTPDELAEMIRLHDRGLTVTEIARRTGRSTGVVSGRLDRAGVREPTHVPLSEAEEDFIIDHVRAGWSVTAVAEAMGRAATTVYAFLTRYGMEYPKAVMSGNGRQGPRVPRINADVGEIRVSPDVRGRVPSVARRSDTLAEVARETGLDPGTVEKILRVDAPVVLTRLRHPKPGRVIANTAGDFVRTEHNLRDYGLIRDGAYDELVTDYGPDAVRDWIEQLTASRKAIARVRYRLRLALERHEARRARGAER